MKVLAVDDSVSILELIKTILTSEGVEVDTAENGADALNKYTKCKPDLVTLDVSMPIMDGYETLTRLMKLDSKAKVVMVTVQEHWPLIEKCLQHGAIGYLAKPFDIKDLVDTVKDPWSYDDKNAIILLSLACNKISNSLGKLFKTDVSVKATKIEIIRQAESPYISNKGADVAQIMVVSKNTAELDINAPTASTGFVTEFGGQQNGMMVSFIKNEDIARIANAAGSYFTFNTNQQDLTREFFSIIHNKIFATIADLTHLILNVEVTKPYDQSKDHAGEQAVKADIELHIKDSVIHIQTQIWSDLRQALKARW